jgi:hypothetical protein
MPMMRQLLRRGLVVSTVILGATGCESTHSLLRSKDNDEVSRKAESDDPTKPKSVESSASTLKSVDSDDNDPQPFFKRTRSSSALSGMPSPRALQAA